MEDFHNNNTSQLVSPLQGEALDNSSAGGQSVGESTAWVEPALPKQKSTYSIRWALLLGVSAIAIFVLVGLSAWAISSLRHPAKTPSVSKTSPSSYSVMNIPLGDLAKSGQLQLTSASQLLINGQLSVNNTLVLYPTTQPSQSTAGELYYDQTDNVLRYYNGQAYVNILDNSAKTSLNNQTGNFTLGQGLALNGNQITNTVAQQTPGVTSLQGETGAVNLTSGGGIQIVGTTIANSGVTSLGGYTGSIGVGNGLSTNGGTLLNDGVINLLSGSASLTVTHDDSGNYTVTENGSGPGGTVSLGPSSPQADTTNNPSISITKQGSGNLLQLATGVTPTNRFVVDQTGAILTGTIGFSQVTGLPNFVNTIGGVSGALTLGSGLSISGQQILNSGVTSLSGTTNQVNVSTATGNVTLSLPQSIAVTSTPTFAGLNLSAPLSVTNGGTGSGTPSGARTNLGAAASGANSDITSLTGLTVINPSSSLTIGANGQGLTLQGSSTSLSQSGGGFTSTLGFASPSANNTITIPDASGEICLKQAQNCLGAGGGGANSSLSNLSSVAINTSLLSGSSSINLGSAANPFNLLYLGGTATNNFQIGGTASAPRSITLPNASGTVCLVELGNCAGSGGGLVGGGTTNTLAIFTSSNSLGNSILTQDSGATTLTVNGALAVIGNAGASTFNGLSLTSNGTGFSVAGGTTSKTLTVTSNATIDQNLAVASSPTFAGLTLSSALPVTSGGTGSASGPGARANLGAAASGANSDITSLSGLTTPLSVGQGGIGANSLTQYGVLIGQGTSAISSVAAVGSNLCLVSTATAPTWQSCPGAGGVSSVNTATGAITIAGASGGSISTVGGSITINDASGSIKGLASFNTSNFTISSGAVNTIQDINISASPTFNALTLTNALQPANGGTGLNTSTPGNGQLLIGNGSGYTLNTLTAGTGITINNTAGSISISAPGSGTCASCANQSLSNLAAVAINTSLLPGTTNSIDLGSNSETFRNEYLAGNLQGNTAKFTSSTNSTTAFQVQNSSGVSALTVDTVSTRVDVGTLGTPVGQLYVSGALPTAAIGSVTTGTGTTSVAISGHYAYVVNSSANTLQAIDVSTPTSPIVISSIATNTVPKSVVISGNYAYVATYSGRSLQIFNISNPASLSLVGTAATYQGGTATSVYVQGRYAYITTQTNGFSGLQIFDISNPVSPTLLGWAAQSGSSVGPVYVQGRYAYVTDNSHLDIYDVSNPYTPSRVGSVSTADSTAASVTVQGRYAYVALRSNLQIFDVSNPATPTGVGLSSFGVCGSFGVAGAISIQGRYAYVADTNFPHTLDICNISDPTNPTAVGAVPTSGLAESVAVSGRYAYVANTAGGANALQIFDLGGEYTQQLEAGGIETSTLNVDNSEQISGNSSIQGSLNVGGSAQITGNVGITGNLSLTGSLQGGNGLSTPSTPNVIPVGTTGSTSYSYEVAAVTSTGGITPASPAGTTTTGNATLTGSNYNAISWTAVTGAISYNVYRVSSGGTPSSTGLIGNTASLSFNDTGIAGTGSAPTTDTSGTITANGTTTINGPTTMKSVTNVTSAFQVQNSAGVSILNVDSVNSRVGVDVTYSSMSAPGTPTLSLQNSPGAPTITPTGTTGSAHYSYNVTAVTSQGLESVPSSAGSTTTGNATLSGTNYNAISWSSVTGASKYNIYRTAITSGSPSTLGFIGTATSTSFNDTGLSASGAVPITTGLTNGTTYYYKVTAIDSAGGETTVSTEASTTTTASGQGIVLHWNPVTGAVGYRIYRGTSSGGETGYYATTGIQSSSSIYFIDNGATQNNTSATPPSSNTAYVSTNNSNSNLQVSVGGNGTPTGQLYVSGTLPSGAVGGVSISSPYSMLVQGKYAYTVSASASDLEVYDLSDPTSPHLVGSASTGDTTDPTNLSVAGNYAYVTTTYPPSIAYVEIFNITNPAAPTLVSSIPLGGYNSFVSTAAQGKYLYIANIYTKLLEIYDVSNASSPAFVGSTSISNGFTSLVASGNYVYGLDGNSSTVLIFDVSNPSAPHQISSTPTLGSPQNLTLSSHYLLVDDNGANEAQIFDISNPYKPISLSSISVRGTGYPALSIAVSDRYAYILNSISGIEVMDISNISNPVLLGTIPTASNPVAIAVSGRYAYVANNSSNTIQVFDLGGAYIQQLETGSAEISDLKVDNSEQIAGNSAIQGNLNVGGSAQISGSVGIGGNLSLGGALQGGNNLSTPGSPIITLSGTSGSTGYSYEVVAVNSGGGTTPASPPGSTTIGNSTLDGTNYNVISWNAVTGATSYNIYRVSSGGTPSSTGLIGNTASTSFHDTGIAGTGTAPTTDTSGSLTFNGATTTNGAATINGATTLNGTTTINGTALVKTATNSTTAFQVQNSSSVSALTVDTTNMRVDVGTSGTPVGQLYVSGSIPSAATGSISADSNAYGMTVSGRYAYVTNSTTNTLQVFDISNPSTPVSVGTGTGANDTQSVVVQGSYAYVSNWGNNTLQIFNISNPTSPVSVGSVSTTNGGTNQAEAIAVSGRYVYFLNQTSLQIFDVSNPTNPTLVSTTTRTGSNGYVGIAAQGNYVYVTGANTTNTFLQIYDVSNPASPSSSLTNTGTVAGGFFQFIKIQGDYAYILDAGSRLLKIYNISNPSSPSSVGSVSVDSASAGNTLSLAVQGNYAYVSNGNSGSVQTFDISTPSSPHSVGSVSMGNAGGIVQVPIAVQGRYVYVVNTNVPSLQVFDMGGEYAQSLQVGGTETGTLAVDGDSTLAGNTSVQGGLTVGQSLQVSGNVGSSGSVLFQNASNSTTAFQVQNATGTDVLAVDTTNTRVCINLASCNNTLGVEGNIAASGTITGGVGSPDYAENITASDQTITAGDLVSMDPNNPSQIVKTSTPYDPNLLGAISTHPGFITNAQASDVDSSVASDPTQRPLALAGRIPVKVSTENGSIAVGDYITSSSTAGVGMKATQAGPVIGRAMSSYSGGGTGSITVYIEPGYYNPASAVAVQSSNGTFTGLQVSGMANIANLTVSGSITTVSLSVAGDANFNGPTVSFSNNVRDYNATIHASATSQTVTFGTAYSDANYAVLCTPNFNSTCYATNKTTAGFTLNFGTAAPSDGSGTVDWFAIH